MMRCRKAIEKIERGKEKWTCLLKINMGGWVLQTVLDQAEFV